MACPTISAELVLDVRIETRTGSGCEGIVMDGGICCCGCTGSDAQVCLGDYSLDVGLVNLPVGSSCVWYERCKCTHAAMVLYCSSSAAPCHAAVSAGGGRERPGLEYVVALLKSLVMLRRLARLMQAQTDALGRMGMKSLLLRVGLVHLCLLTCINRSYTLLCKSITIVATLACHTTSRMAIT